MILEDLEDFCINLKKNEIIKTQEIIVNKELNRVFIQGKEITVKLY
jgi:hypothetical protein